MMKKSSFKEIKKKLSLRDDEEKNILKG